MKILPLLFTSIHSMFILWKILLSSAVNSLDKIVTFCPFLNFILLVCFHSWIIAVYIVNKFNIIFINIFPSYWVKDCRMHSRSKYIFNQSKSLKAVYCLIDPLLRPIGSCGWLQLREFVMFVSTLENHLYILVYNNLIYNARR